MTSFLKKKTFFLFPLILGGGLFLPLFLVKAQPWYLKALYGLPNAIVLLALRLVLLIIGFFFKLANWLLSWTISNPFGLSFTDPGGNPIIRIGWTLLRDFTNIIFILGLAYIGLAIALNLAGFNTKKAFGTLLVVALLINFTPVIAGIIVDISNIIAGFFWANVDFNLMAETFKIFQGDTHVWLENLMNPLNTGRTILLILFGVAGTFILFIFSFLYFIRPVMIWMLVILSPVAFLGLVFREIKGIPIPILSTIWSRWWNQFLQWSMIGIPTAFFLYLGAQILAHLSEFQPSGTPLIGQFLVELAPYLIVIFFLYIGFFLSLQITAIGAGVVMGVAKQTMGSFLGGAQKGARTLRAFLRARRTPRPGEEDWEEWKEAHKTRAKIKEGMGVAGKFFFGGLTEEEKKRWGKGWRIASDVIRGVTTPFTLGAPFLAKPLKERVGRYLQAQMATAQEKEISLFKAKTKGKNLETQRLMFENTPPGLLGRARRIGALEAIVEDGNLPDLIKMGVPKEEIKKTIIEGVKTHPAAVQRTLRFIDFELSDEIYRDLRRKLSPRILKEAGIYYDPREDGKKGYKNLYDKLVATMSPAKIKFMLPEAFEKLAKAEPYEALLPGQKNDPFYRFWHGGHISEAGRVFGGAALGAILKGREVVTETKDSTKQREWFDKHNPLLGRFFDSPGAHILGISYPKREVPSRKPPTFSEEELEKIEKEYLHGWFKTTREKREEEIKEKIKEEVKALRRIGKKMRKERLGIKKKGVKKEGPRIKKKK